MEEKVEEGVQVLKTECKRVWQGEQKTQNCTRCRMMLARGSLDGGNKIACIYM